MILTVLMPDQSQVNVTVADDTLVFDGMDFLEPERIKYVVLYKMPVAAVSLPFDDIASVLLSASVRIRALVLNRFLNPYVGTDPKVVVVPKPVEGDQCVCFVTCKGTELRFVQVHTVEA